MSARTRRRAAGLTAAIVTLLLAAVWWIDGAGGDHARAGEFETAAPPPSVGEQRADGELAMLEARIAQASVAPDSALLRVADACGNPVAGADVALVTATGARALGHTDAAGILSIARARLHGGAALEVRAQGRGRVEIELSPAAVELRAVIGSSLRGRVVLDDPLEQPAGIRVLAIAGGRVPNPDEIRALVDSDDAEHVALTQADGSFEFRALQAGVDYALVAGGNGYASSAMARGLSACSNGVELELETVYGARICVVDAQGKRPATSSRLATRDGVHWRMNGPPARERTAWAPEVVLAESPLDLSSTDGEQFDHVFLALAPSRLQRLGPLDFSIEVPGYGRGAAVASLVPLRDGIKPVPCKLSGTAPDCVGSLELYVHGGAIAELARDPSERAWAALYLTGPGGERYEIGLWSSSSRPDRIEGVPCGRYRATLATGHRYFRFPRSGSLELEVEPSGEPAVVAIDLSGTGAVEVHAAERDGGPLRDVLVLELQRLGSDGSTFSAGPMVFENPPYVIPALPEGRYLLVPDHGFELHGASTALAEGFEVRAGDTVVCELRERAH